MRTAGIAAALALGAAPWVAAGVEVSGGGESLNVSADRAPLSEVLDGLARKTRMKVLYEGATPRTLVTIELREQTPAQAVVGVLEGLGLNYALLLDATGVQVETLMIVGAGATSTSSLPSRSTTRAQPQPPQEVPDTQPDEADERRAEPAPDPHEVPKEPAPKATPAPAGPLNPVNPFSSSPFGPAPRPAGPPAPVPTASPAASPQPPAS